MVVLVGARHEQAAVVGVAGPHHADVREALQILSKSAIYHGLCFAVDMHLHIYTSEVALLMFCVTQMMKKCNGNVAAKF